MFFVQNHFIDLTDEETASAIATLANSIIAKQGKTVYGTLFKDGSVEQLSTSKDIQDTHTCMVIGLAEMGNFVSTKAVHVDTTAIDEIATAQAALNRQLRVENDSLRSKDNE